MRRLVYHIWAYNGVRENPIYELHLRCLSFYNEIFSDVVFCIAMEDITDDELYRNIVYDILQCGFDKKNCTFKKIKNNKQFREGETCYNELIKKLSNYDGITMFGHMKGLTNCGKCSDTEDVLRDGNFKNISCWVCGMYYSLLNDIKSVENMLYRDNVITYGAYLLANNNSGDFMYCGSFYWLNTFKLYNFLKVEKREIPLLCDISYAENVLGKCLRPFDWHFIRTFNNQYYITAADLYHNAFKNSEIVFSTKYIDFLNFYNEMTKGLINE